MRIALLLWFLCSAPALAHEVRHIVAASGAVAVSLSYADGQPFAYEAFEATPEGAAAPTQVGRTDARGRAVFIPGAVKRWHLRAFSADGHGVDIRFEAPALASPATPAQENTASRVSLLLFGLSLLLAVFAVLQLWVRKPR